MTDVTKHGEGFHFDLKRWPIMVHKDDIPELAQALFEFTYTPEPSNALRPAVSAPNSRVSALEKKVNV